MNNFELTPDQREALKPWLEKLRQGVGSVVIIAVESDTALPRVGWLDAKEREALRKGLNKINAARAKKLEKRGVSDSLAHGIGRAKAAAFAAVPDVIEKGIVLETPNQLEGEGYDAVTIGAPVRIAEVDYVAVVVVHKQQGLQRFYLHDRKMRSNRPRSRPVPVPLTRQRLSLPARLMELSRLLLREIFEVKESSFSIKPGSYIDRVAERLDSVRKAPAQRVVMYEKARTKLRKLSADRNP